MNYLVTMKDSNEKVLLQRTMSESATLNLVVDAFCKLMPIDETSGFLRATKFLSDIKPGSAKAIENEKNNHKIIIQVGK